MSCDALCGDLKKEITKVVNKLFISRVSELINEYVGDGSHLYVLHSKSNTYDIEHVICDNCFQNMEAIALMCDTNQSKCPVCPRNIYMP